MRRQGTAKDRTGDIRVFLRTVTAVCPDRHARVSCASANEEEYMTGPGRSDLVGRLADLSEEALQRLADMPGADRAISAMNNLRDRVDDLQKRVRGLEALEQRLTALERKVDKLSKESTATGTARRSTKTTSTKTSGGSVAKLPE